MTSTSLEVDPRVGPQSYPGKSCGSCTACCRAVPVREMGVKAFQTCPVVTDRGCGVYAMRPKSCRVWSCGWLIGDLPDEYRPDRLGLIFDPMPDVAALNGQEVVASQIWVLPGHEDDWEKPLVNELIVATVDRGIVVLWRQRGPKGEQWARAFWRDPVTGEYAMSDPAPADTGFSARRSEGERFADAQRLLETK